VPVVVTTHPVEERCIRNALTQIDLMDIVEDRPVCIPLLDEEGGGGE
jgi:hypothetical protein